MSSDIKSIQNKAQQYLLEQKLSQAKKNIGEKNSNSDIKEAAQQFESLFIHRLLKEMRKTVMKSELLGEGFGGEIFKDMFDEKLAEEISGRSTLGLANLIAKQLGSQENFETKEFAPLKPLKPAPPVKLNYMNKKLEPYLNDINASANEIKISPNLIQAVILAESGGNSKAISAKGAKGLMQLMDTTAAEVGVKNAFDPSQNIRGGSIYLKKMLTLFDGDLEKALAAYNAGPNAVKKYNGVPPYKETENYVKKTKAYFSALGLSK
jgi:Rod binding domain-containing protein